MESHLWRSLNSAFVFWNGLWPPWPPGPYVCMWLIDTQPPPSGCSQLRQYHNLKQWVQAPHLGVSELCVAGSWTRSQIHLTVTRPLLLSAGMTDSSVLTHWAISPAPDSSVLTMTEAQVCTQYRGQLPPSFGRMVAEFSFRIILFHQMRLKYWPYWSMYRLE